MEFKIGDMVKWRSQAGGHWTEKQGKIVYELQPHHNPVRVWHDHFIGHRRMYDGLRPPEPRKRSYLIEVLDGKNRMPKLYMPRPVLLKKAKELPAYVDLSIEDYENLIIQWATERGLLAGTTPTKQTLKLMEEAGELCKAMMLEDEEKIQDAIGDMLVVMVNLCSKLGMCLHDCISVAWEEIKDRKGRMLNGSFVKESE